jgi:hypothetical protein
MHGLRRHSRAQQHGKQAQGDPKVRVSFVGVVGMKWTGCYKHTIGHPNLRLQVREVTDHQPPRRALN